jgi:predicted lipoprotein
MRLVEPASADDDLFETDQEVLDEWVNRMAFTVEDIRFERLGKPMGDASGGEPQYDTIESPYSGEALSDIAAILGGVSRVFEGDLGPGVEALLPHDSPIRDAFRTRLALAQDALLVVPEPLSVAVVDGRSEVAAVQDALRDLQVVIQVDLAQALGVTVVFNDNDGD